MPDDTPPKPRLRLVLCELSTGRCLADAKLDDPPILTGDLALLRAIIAHLPTILPKVVPTSHE